METIISAGISTVGAIIICIITQVVLANKQTAELRKDTTAQTSLLQGEINVIKVRMDVLTEKVEKHNNFMERIAVLEREADVYEEKMKVANHRIDDLEQRARQS